MSNVYVYTDKNKVIHEISLKSRGDLLNYDVTVIPFGEAADFLALYRKCQRTGNLMDPIHLLDGENGRYTLRSTLYVYYDKNKSISSIAPRKQSDLDEDKNLKVGFVVLDDLINDFIDGKKSLIKYKVNDDQELLVLEEIIDKTQHTNFIDYIKTLGDYELNTTDEYLIEIIHNQDNILDIIKHDDLINHFKVDLYIVDKFDRTKLYNKISFIFDENNNKIVKKFDILNEFIIISPNSNIIKYTRECND